jgi:hypothetical protein
VAAIVDSAPDYFCWVKVGDQIKKRALRIGDTNDQFTVVLDGINEGDEVILNPLAFVEEAQRIAIESKSGAEPQSERSKASPGT